MVAARPAQNGGLKDYGQWGVTRLVVQGILNQKDRSVTAVYARYGADPKKKAALIEWGWRVEQIASGGAPGRVVDFRARSVV